MINRFTILLLAAALFAPTAHAQKKGTTDQMGFSGATVFTQGKDPKTLAYEYYIGIGYAFNKRFALRIQPDLAIHLFEYPSHRDYRLQGALGLGAGYNVVANGVDIVEVGAMVGNTIGGDNFRYNYYDGGVKWAFGNGKERTRMYVGLGVRHYHSQRKEFKSRTSGYATLGFRIN